MFGYESQEFFADLGFDVARVWRVEPDYLAISAPLRSFIRVGVLV